MTEIRYGFDSQEQAYIFKCEDTTIRLCITNPASAAFMRFLMEIDEKFKSQNPRARVHQSKMVADNEAPYSIAGTDVDKQWEKLYEAYRAVQSATGGAGNPV